MGLKMCCWSSTYAPRYNKADVENIWPGTSEFLCNVSQFLKVADLNGPLGLDLLPSAYWGIYVPGISAHHNTVELGNCLGTHKLSVAFLKKARCLYPIHPQVPAVILSVNRMLFWNESPWYHLGGNSRTMPWWQSHPWWTRWFIMAFFKGRSAIQSSLWRPRYYSA